MPHPTALICFSSTGRRRTTSNRSLLARAEASGCEAIVVTLDTHLLGWRTRDLDLAYLPFTRGMGIAQYTSDPVFQQLVRERAAAPKGDAPGVRVTPKAVSAALTIARKGAPLTGGGSLRDNLRSPLPRAAVETFLDVFSTPALTWGDLAKGARVDDPADHPEGHRASRRCPGALDAGLDGIWVSNHGGRQIDRSVPTLDVLPEIADRVAGRVPIVFDSGVRGGADAVIALALGATVVALGRPYAYGLGVAGRQGCARSYGTCSPSSTSRSASPG